MLLPPKRREADSSLFFKRMRSCLTALGLVFLSLYAARAQNSSCQCTLEVQVLDSVSGQPLTGVWVRAPGADSLIWTDHNGFFRVLGLCEEKDIPLQVFLAGYRPKEPVYRCQASMGRHILYLHRWGALLDEVSVHAHHRPSLFESGESLGEKELLARSGLPLAKVAEGLPGLRTHDHGMTLSKPVIHGLSGVRIQVIADEMSLEDQSWGAEHAPMMDAQQLGEIRLVEGAAGLRYGSAAAGRILRGTPEPMRATPGFKLKMQAVGMSNGRGGGGNLQWDQHSHSIPGLAWRVSAGGKRAGNYRIPGYDVANSGFAETSLGGRMSYTRKWGQMEGYISHLQHRIGMYAGAHTGSTDDLLLAIHSPYPRVQEGFSYAIGRPEQAVAQTRMGFHFHSDFALGALDFRYGFQSNLREEFEPRRGAGNQAQLHLDLRTHQINLDWEHDIRESIHGHLGIDLSHASNRFRDGDRFLIPAYDAKKAALYLIETLEAGGLDWEGGIRLDFQQFEVYQPEGSNQQIQYYEDRYFKPSFSLGIAKRWPGLGDTRLQYHASWRPPHVAERFSRGLHQGAARMEFGNPNLEVERSHGLFLDQNFRWSRGRLRARFYGQVFDGLIYLEPGDPVLSIRGSFRSYHYEQVPAQLWGSEFTWEQTWTSFWQSVVQGSWIWAQDRSRHDWLIGMPADQYQLRQRFLIPAGKSSLPWIATLNIRHLSTQKRIPRDFDQRDYLRPPGAYSLFSAGLEKSLAGKWGSWQLQLECDNLLNTVYRDYLDAFRYYLDRPGRNFILRIHFMLEGNKKEPLD